MTSYKKRSQFTRIEADIIFHDSMGNKLIFSPVQNKTVFNADIGSYIPYTHDVFIYRKVDGKYVRIVTDWYNKGEDSIFTRNTPKIFFDKHHSLIYGDCKAVVKEVKIKCWNKALEEMITEFYNGNLDLSEINPIAVESMRHMIQLHQKRRSA